MNISNSRVGRDDDFDTSFVGLGRRQHQHATFVKQRLDSELVTYGRRRSFEVAQTSVNILDHNDPPSLMLTILPQKGFYVGGSFRFSVRVSHKYPFEAPVVVSIDGLQHPNICPHSFKIRMPVLREWTASKGIQELVEGVEYMLMEPYEDQEYAANIKMLQVWRKDRRTFQRLAMKEVESHHEIISRKHELCDGATTSDSSLAPPNRAKRRRSDGVVSQVSSQLASVAVSPSSNRKRTLEEAGLHENTTIDNVRRGVDRGKNTTSRRASAGRGGGNRHRIRSSAAHTGMFLRNRGRGSGRGRGSLS